jgi:hypothetical protein
MYHLPLAHIFINGTMGFLGYRLGFTNLEPSLKRAYYPRYIDKKKDSSKAVLLNKSLTVFSLKDTLSLW